MKNIYSVIFLLLTIVIMAGACRTKSVTRVNADKQIDLSGRWNDTDSRLVAEEMVKDAMSRHWMPQFSREKSRQPVIIVGIVTNKSHEHIEAETFIKDIEREFINSGTIRIVQNSVFREKMREERADQNEFASPASAKRWGRELGADYMMFGTINSIVDTEGKRRVNFYQINLELSDLETNETVWIGDKKIKKYIVN